MIDDIISEEMFDDDIVLSLVDDDIDDEEEAEDELLTDGEGDSDAIDAVLSLEEDECIDCE